MSKTPEKPKKPENEKTVEDALKQLLENLKNSIKSPTQQDDNDKKPDKT